MSARPLRWRYVAQHADGRTASGELAAPSEPEAAKALAAQGLTPVRLTARRGMTPELGERVSAARWAVLVRSLADLTGAAVPVRDALAALKSRARPGEAALFGRLLEKVESGTSLSEALKADPAGAPPMVPAMVAAGEASGRLPVVLDTLAGELEAGVAVRRELVSLLVYPAAVFALFVATVFFLSHVVLPQFETLFRGAGAAPPETAFVLAAGAAVRAAGVWVLLASLLLVLVAGRLLSRRPEIGAAIAEQVPVVSGVRARLDVARYARTLALLLENGQPIARAEPTARALVGSPERRARLAAAAGLMRDGAGPGQAFEKTNALPADMIDLIKLGERTGALTLLLNRAAGLYEQAARRTVRRGAALAGPVLIAVLGIVMAGLIAGVMSGVLSLNEVVY
ncbi:MAG: type II secretion system F family protein [Oceanicaulis sp.]